ncbi:MAG: potassium transporter TrkG [Elusimicrobiota bacterium]
MFKSLKPSQFLLFFFFAITLSGALLLYTPFAHKSGQEYAFIDSLFMATSAVCVTGLSVLDINASYSLFGQIVLLILMSIGGLGYMTLATIIAAFLGKVSLKDKLIIKEVIDIESFEGIKYLLFRIFLITLIFETVGTVILTFCFLSKMSLPQALYYGMFHSISAFNNCGLGLWSNSLEGFKDNYLVLTTVMVLIFSGGIGYIVINELSRIGRGRKLSTHSRIALSSSAILILAAALLIFIAEYSNYQTLGRLTFGEKILSSFFQAVAPRTAGFNSLPIGAMRELTLLLIIYLMYVGASPGSTGGGIKTTTFSILVAATWSVVRGRQDTNLMGSRISSEIVKKCMAISFLALTALFVFSGVIFYIENFRFLDVVFEVTSALGTVGFSTGITPKLSTAGKALILSTMLIGRLGALTIGIAFLQRDEDIPYKFPEERVLIG